MKTYDSKVRAKASGGSDLFIPRKVDLLLRLMLIYRHSVRVRILLHSWLSNCHSAVDRFVQASVYGAKDSAMPCPFSSSAALYYPTWPCILLILLLLKIVVVGYD